MVKIIIALIHIVSCGFMLVLADIYRDIILPTQHGISAPSLAPMHQKTHIIRVLGHLMTLDMVVVQTIMIVHGNAMMAMVCTMENAFRYATMGQQYFMQVI